VIAAAAIGALCALSPLAGTKALADSFGEDSGRAVAIAQLNAPLAAERSLTMVAWLKLHNQEGLDRLLEDQQDPSSPDYHQWLTPQEFGQRFGPSQAELDRVARWLAGKGFVVDSASRSTRTISFHGTARTASAALGVNFKASADGGLFANLNDPKLPAAIGDAVAWVGGLDNLVAKAPRARTIAPRPEVDINDLGQAFGPPDIYSFYDETPLLNASPVPIDGRNTDCVAVAEDTDITPLAADAFNTQFNLPAFNYSLEPGTNFQTVYADSKDPGINSDEVEALLDVGYAHAVAPGANIVSYVGNGAHAHITGLGFLDAAIVAIRQDRCGAISISYDLCGGGTAFFQQINSAFAQGAAQGQSIFIASGDEGSANLVLNTQRRTCVIGKNRGVEVLESSPHVTSVGGTMFNPDYDGNGNNVGDVPESVWDDVYGAGGGGKSGVFGKPAYQKGLTPKDLRRDVPDISFGASPAFPGFYVGFHGTGASADTVGWLIEGGTSVGAPSWAGISMLIQQKEGRVGLINPRLYALGPLGAAAGIRDVTEGNNGYNGAKGYAAVPGYDQATGWGTPDIAGFVSAYVGQ